jgi:hypothetical protein
MEERLARLRTHQSNIDRYQGLLKTKLSDIELQFLERRLTEERMAMAMLELFIPSRMQKRPPEGGLSVT